jgi:hypothetical protein
MAKVANRQALPERNVLKANILRAPLDFIAEIIQAYHWDYLYNCVCPVYPRLVHDFYGLLEVVQDDDRGIILQTTVEGHIIQIDPQIISSTIGVPVLPILANPFSEVMEPPSIEQLKDYFDAHPQGDECCANFNTRKRTNRLQYSVCASARSYPQGIALQKLISI